MEQNCASSTWARATPVYNSYMSHAALVASPPKIYTDIAIFIDEYADIFVEPTELPPARSSFDHIIPLKEGTNSFSLRP